MTKDDVNLINYYRKQGHGYKKISVLTGLPQSAVKAYLYRHPEDEHFCLSCGRPVTQTPHKREKKYCSNSCRWAWWNAHPDMVNRTRTEHICSHCGSVFLTHRKGQKYCSRACFADARRKEVVVNG